MRDHLTIDGAASGAAAAARHALAARRRADWPQTPSRAARSIVTYKDDVTTLDPAIGYDWQNWSMIKRLFDGLMDYKPGTTELEPDLAESYDDLATTA